MNLYHLYLDEILPSEHFDYFCLAGIAVKENEYTNEMIPSINQLKEDIFGRTTVILHDYDLKRPKRNTEFEVMLDRSIAKQFWKRMQDLFRLGDFHTFSVCIHKQELKRMYPGMRDKYFISLQVILENYVNFLQRYNGKGNIIIESRNPKQDEQLQQHFHSLVATGTLFYESILLQKHLGTISFPLKAENIIGLQMADLIPNPLNRSLSHMKQKEDGLLELINQKAYNGGSDYANRFGHKIIP